MPARVFAPNEFNGEGALEFPSGDAFDLQSLELISDGNANTGIRLGEENVFGFTSWGAEPYEFIVFNSWYWEVDVVGEVGVKGELSVDVTFPGLNAVHQMTSTTQEIPGQYKFNGGYEYEQLSPILGAPPTKQAFDGIIVSISHSIEAVRISGIRMYLTSYIGGSDILDGGHAIVRAGKLQI